MNGTLRQCHPDRPDGRSTENTNQQNRGLAAGTSVD